jgi:FPC/CPF motif-containing protein YcgG
MTPIPEQIFTGAVVKKSFCLYAPGAVIKYADNFIVNETEDLSGIHRQFQLFDDKAIQGKYDAFVIGFSLPEQNADKVITFGTHLLFTLASMNKGEAAARELIQHASTKDWWYTFGSTRYFILCFSDSYAPGSPRYVDRKNTAFLMFQPVHSFDRKATPVGGAIAMEKRTAIRENHKRNGKPYDHTLAQSMFEGQKIFHGIQSRYSNTWWETNQS